MGRNLTNLYISESFQYLVQISGSEFETGLGVAIPSIDITASNAVSSSYSNTAVSASYAATALSSSHAINANNAVSASYAITASYALNVPTVDTGSLMKTGSVNSNVLTFTKGDGSTFNLTVDTGSAVTTNTGSLLVTASAAANIITFTKGDGSTFPVTVDTGSAVSTPTGSLLTTASAAGNVITFTKGDGSTFPVTVDTGSAISASYATTASLALNNVLTASSTNDTITYTKGDGTTFNNVINNVNNANTASVATTASYALTASYAQNVPTVNTSSFVITASTVDATTTYTKGDGSTFNTTINNVSASISASYATSASIAETTVSASYATTASYSNTSTSASYADTALSSSYAINSTSASYANTATSASYAATASYVNLGTSNATAFTASTTWNYNHNLGTQLITIDTYDSNYEEIIPQSIDLIDNFNAVITFPVAVAGFAVASLGNGVSSVTSSTINNYYDVSPSSLYSSQQSTVLNGSASYTIAIPSQAVYNVHVSQSGTYLIDASTLSTTSASVNLYFYPEAFPTSSMASVAFYMATGSSTAINFRSLVSASVGYQWWNTNTNNIGASNTSLTRSTTRKSILNPTTVGNPYIMYKSATGVVSLSVFNGILGNTSTWLIHSGSEGTAIT